jgi:anaerobic magnesium-protoporphyrin IX monomethyl ester cyclase
MHIVLWDTRRNGVTKDFAGGFGVGQFPRGGGLLAAIIRRGMARDRRPVALAYAYLAAIFRSLGHTVEYAEDRVPPGADVYVFHPALVTLPLERQAIRRALDGSAGCRVLVAGVVAHTLPEAFDGLDVTILRGEPEQLFWQFDAVLADRRQVIELGRVADLDALPAPDWSLFAPRRFRVGYDFSQFPTAFVQSSRGCTLACNYCPYIVVGRSIRLRKPERVVAEIADGAQRYGFRSFKFRDPLFGLDQAHALEIAGRLNRLRAGIQFSIESRIDLLREDTLRALRAAGLSSITFGVETPDEATLRRYRRAPIRDDRQQRFIELCRRLDIRTVAGFMIGFPDDTTEKIETVLRYARALNPTFANFNVVTPYPGTEFFAQVKSQIAHFDYSQYSVYQPVLEYAHLSAERVAGLHTRCFVSYYFRSRWLAANAQLVWPAIGRLGAGRGSGPDISAEQPPAGDRERQDADDQREKSDAAGGQLAA